MNPLSLDGRRSLAEAFFALAEAHPDQVAYEQSVSGDIDITNLDAVLTSPRQWVTTNYRTMRQQVLTVANYLRTLGVVPGVRVAIVSGTRPEWMIADLAIQSLGATTVSIYQSVTAADIGYILYDSGAQYIIAENQEQVDKLKSLLRGPVDIPSTEERPATTAQIGLRRIITFEEVDPHPLCICIKDLSPASDEETRPHEVESISREDLAALVYTSGTTGPPKGVIQTQGNHLSNVRQAYQSGLFSESSSIMLVLPLAHAFAKLMGYIGFLTLAHIKFPAIIDRRSSKLLPESVTRDIKEGSATIVPIVPRLLEKMEAGIRAKALGSGLGGFLVRTTLQSPKGSVGYTLTGFIRKKIKRTLFGKDFQYGISGGAKLATDTAKFFDHIGITILQGYGLTETVVATNVNRLESNRIGTVGPVLSADIELKIADDGEICFRGPNVAQGYLNRPTATSSAWDAEGWFHTGDLGSLSPDGFLSITGRKKEIIVTSNGKKIAPEIIEQRFKAACPIISQFLMYGEARSSNVALISLNLEAARAWAKSRGVAFDQKLRPPAELLETIQAGINRVNKELSNFEQVHRFHVLDEEFTIENGLLTPTFKVKRAASYKRYQSVIDALYNTPGKTT